MNNTLYIQIPSGSGDLAITGVGFAPKTAYAIASVTDGSHLGMTRGCANKATPIVQGYLRTTVDTGNSQDTFQDGMISGWSNWSVLVKSFDSDGVTLTYANPDPKSRPILLNLNS